MWQPKPSVRRPKTTFKEESMTEQAHKDSCDIHHIMKQYEQHGMITHVNQHEGIYADLISYPDFQEAQNRIAEAISVFETIPAEIRQDFGNDPARFLDFIQNPANIEQIEAYGFSSSHLQPLEEITDPTLTPPESQNAPTEPPEPSQDD